MIFVSDFFKILILQSILYFLHPKKNVASIFRTGLCLNQCWDQKSLQLAESPLLWSKPVQRFRLATFNSLISGGCFLKWVEIKNVKKQGKGGKNGQLFGKKVAFMQNGTVGEMTRPESHTHNNASERVAAPLFLFVVSYSKIRSPPSQSVLIKNFSWQQLAAENLAAGP